MKTVFTVANNKVFVSSRNPEQDLDKLPVGVYTVNYDKQLGYHLVASEMPEIPGKMYDNPSVRAEKILNTFQKRGKGMGVLLSGTRGTGKSLLSRIVSKKALDAGIPVLNIINPYAGDDFNLFLNNINQQIVINIDEYEKVYFEEEVENQLLSLMDGVGTVKALWLLTVNETEKISKYLLNRPSRVYYNFKYGTLSKEVVREVFIDAGMTQDVLDELEDVYGMFQEWTFDVATSIANEIKMYGGGILTNAEHMCISVKSPKDNIEFGFYTWYLNGEKIAVQTFRNVCPEKERSAYLDVRTCIKLASAIKILELAGKMDDEVKKIVAEKGDNEMVALEAIFDHLDEFIGMRLNYAGFNRNTGGFVFNTQYAGLTVEVM